jgi:hypothetical protein
LDIISKAANNSEPVITPLAETSGTNSEPDNISAWAINVDYKVGVRVIHEGIVYECRQAHTSQISWPPPLTPALWQAIEVQVPPTEPPKINTPLFRKRVLLLPFNDDLKPVISSSEEEQKKVDDERKAAAAADEKRATELLNNHGGLKAAITELTQLSSELLETKVAATAEGTDVDPNLSYKRLVADQLDYTKALRNVALKRATPTSANTTLAEEPGPSSAPDPEKPATLLEPTGAFSLAKDLLSGSSSVLRPLTAFHPPALGERMPHLKEGASHALTESTRKLLSDRQIDLSQTSVKGEFQFEPHFGCSQACVLMPLTRNRGEIGERGRD